MSAAGEMAYNRALRAAARDKRISVLGDGSPCPDDLLRLSNAGKLETIKGIGPHGAAVLQVIANSPRRPKKAKRERDAKPKATTRRKGKGNLGGALARLVRREVRRVVRQEVRSTLRELLKGEQ